MSTAYSQHIQILLCATTLHSILALLFIYAFLFTMWYFPQLPHNSLYKNVYSVSLTYTYSTVYNYTTQYTVCAFYICCPFHNVIFFHNYCTIDSTTMSIAYPQHIHAVLFTITLPSILYVLLHMLSFSQCEYFSTHYCTIVYMTMFTFNVLCLHAVLFTITLHSILIVFCIYILSLHNDNVLTITITLHYNNDYSERPCLHTVLTVYNYTIQYTDLLFTYVILFTMDIFSQLLHNWHYTNVCSISSTYTYNTVWNTLPSIMTLLSPTVLFTITLPSIVSVMFTYAFLFSMWIFVKTLLYNCYIKCLHWIFTVTYGTVYNYSPQYTYFAVYICFLFTMWYFFTITAQFTLQQCLQHILNIYIQYYLQLHYQIH